MKKVLFPLFVVLVLFTQSCTDSLIDVNSPREGSNKELFSTDGILCFEDFSALDRFCQQNASLSDIQRKALESKYNYTSIQSTYINKNLPPATSEILMYYNGAVGAYLNKDRMVIIKNRLYLFDNNQTKYISLENTNLTQAKILINDATQENNPIVHVNVSKEVPIIDKNTRARVSSGYLVQSNRYDYHNGSHSYSTASLTAKFVWFDEYNRSIQVIFNFRAIVTFNANLTPNICTDVIHQASGDFIMYQPKRLSDPGLLGPFSFSVNISPEYGYGSRDVVVAAFPVGSDAEPRLAAYFEGTGSFSTSHGTCYIGRQVTTTGIMNL